MLASKAHELIKELDRSQDASIPPHNMETIRFCQLESNELYRQNHEDVQSVINQSDQTLLPTIALRHAAIQRIKRCLLTYSYQRLNKIKRLRWTTGSILTESIKNNLSLNELDFFSNYNQTLSSYMRSIGNNHSLDLLSYTQPPKKLHVHVKCLIDYGPYEALDGTTFNLTLNSEHFVMTSDAEHLIQKKIVEHICQMPSDSKKKREAQKKAVGKQRYQQKKSTTASLTTNDDENNDERENDDEEVNDEEPTTTTTTTTTKTTTVKESTNGLSNGSTNDAAMAEDANVKSLIQNMDVLTMVEKMNTDARSCTGVLGSHPHGRDVHIHQFSLSFWGQEILADTEFEMNCGRRYGLVGLNGSGKSTMLACLGNREVPIPEHVDIFYLSREMAPLNKSALQCVMEVDKERIRLETEAERLAAHNDDENFQE
ncbi:unnamed protein product [Didymodactylos carnosus]|uniref:DNA replication complex GINS protein PSF1 n=1 Tax=Didymodactylos carnosus TaxID=1234261 RepID=A0A813QPQ8_9BILA|nr:unnamed protein product [Didymodactylos carnosus]CAF0985343.1 unnamed protein product [Didymodactylos carnosus]CAF3552283.1 unnamed protein product [Didymodactylos carnosus]CAF3755673.1 unnamed protein product [Didymodactylos carnosus]